MSILITGGAGFIGTHLATRLIEADQDVIIFGHSIDKIKKNLAKATHIKGDITNEKQINELCAKHNIDSIFHLASILPPKTEEEPFLAFQVNVAGTINILKAAQNHNISTIIYPSSSSIFGPARTPPFSMDKMYDPWTFYSSYKVCVEILGSIYSKKYNINFRAVRFPVVIGPGRARFSGMSNYPIEMLQDAIHGVSYEANIEPEMQLPIIYIEDAVQILINLWRSEKVQFEIYEVDGLWVSAKEIAEGIKKIIPTANITFKPVEDKNIAKILTGIKDQQEKTKFAFKDKRVLDEILEEYITREKLE